jgi:nucleoside-diphosphate-sugar epimerase
MRTPADILVTGGTGYIGGHLIPALLARGHRVRVLAREQSASRVPAGALPIVGDALNVQSIEAALQPEDTVIHLVGTPHPTPTKADQFEKIDLVSIRATVSAAKNANIAHLIYVSVAQPAPIMQAYLWIRTLGETMIRESQLTATILRPWYVLGPGRRWPLLVKPFYGLMEMIPATRPTAERLGLITIEQMIVALVSAVENPPLRGQRRIVDVPAIRRARMLP